MRTIEQLFDVEISDMTDPEMDKFISFEKLIEEYIKCPKCKSYIISGGFGAMLCPSCGGIYKAWEIYEHLDNETKEQIRNALDR